MKKTITIAAAAIMLSGCACTDYDHMATTNWMDRHIVPENRAMQWIATPLLVPTALLTLTVDNVIITPIVHLPSAWEDTLTWWEADFESYYTQMGILPIRAALTPVVFLGSETCRSFFSIQPESGAAWGWPEWGEAWVRDSNGRLLGPPSKYDPKTKEPAK